MGEHSHPRRRRKGVCPMQQHTHCWSALLQHTHEGPTRPLKSFWECPLSLELQAPCPQCSPRKRLGRKGLVFAIIASVWMCLNRKRTCSRRRERAAQGGLGFHIILIHRSPRLRQSQHSNTHLQHALATRTCNTHLQHLQHIATHLQHLQCAPMPHAGRAVGKTCNAPLFEKRIRKIRCDGKRVTALCTYDWGTWCHADWITHKDI